MEKINLKKLIEAIKSVCKNAPITYRNEAYLVFRGDSLLIKNGNKAMTWKYDFTFESAGVFIENLQHFGLMLSQSEYHQIMNEYKRRLSC